MEKDITDLSEHSTAENLGLVIKRPANCTSVKKCQYILDNFVSIKGIDKKAAELT